MKKTTKRTRRGGISERELQRAATAGPELDALAQIIREAITIIRREQGETR